MRLLVLRDQVWVLVVSLYYAALNRRDRYAWKRHGVGNFGVTTVGRAWLCQGGFSPNIKLLNAIAFFIFCEAGGEGIACISPGVQEVADWWMGQRPQLHDFSPRG